MSEGQATGSPASEGSNFESQASNQAPSQGQPSQNSEPKPPAEKLVDLLSDKSKYKFKAEDGEYELNELLEGHRKRNEIYKAADERFQHAAKARQQLRAMQEKLSTDPLSALMQLGVPQDVLKKQFEGWYKQTYIDPEQMSPQERDMAERERRIRDAENKQKQEAESAKQARIRQQAELYHKHYQTAIINAVSQSGMPADEVLIKRVGEQLSLALDAGYDMGEVMPIAVERAMDTLRGQSRQFVSKLEGKSLLSFLGDEAVDKIIKAKIADIRGVSAQPAQPQGDQQPKLELEQPSQRRYLQAKPSERLRPHEWRETFSAAKITVSE